MAEAYIPLSFAPGEAYQFGWSHEAVLLDGVTVASKQSICRNSPKTCDRLAAPGKSGFSVSHVIVASGRKLAT